MKLWSLLSRWFRRPRYEQELDEELAFHLDCRRADLMTQGLDGAAAERQARIELGMVELHKDAVRAAHGFAWLDSWLGDLRRAARGLASSPAYVIGSVLILGIAIGANLLLHALWQNYMATPPATAQPGLLFDLDLRSPDSGFVPPLDAKELATLEAALDLDAKGLVWSRQVNLALTDRDPRMLYGAAVSRGYFSILATRATEGRTLLPADFQGKSENVVLGDRLWRQLSAQGRRLGDTIALGGMTLTIVGVVPEAFAGLEPFPPQFFVTDVIDQQMRRAQGNEEPPRYVTSLLLRPESSVAAMTDRLKAILLSLESRRLPELAIGNVRLLERRSQLSASESEGAHGAVLPVLALTLLLLVAACANLGNLMLARATMRRQELAIRASLGASRWRLLRLLLLESLLLAVMAAGVGLIFCTLSVEPLHRYGMSMLVALGIEPLVMTFQTELIGWALLQALVACLAFGLLPALAITGNDLAHAARRDSALFNGRIQASKLRGVLMSAQVAVSLVLLITSALIIDATRRADSVDIGYPVDQIVDLRHPAADADLRRHIERLPGVLNTAAVDGAPLYGSTFATPMRIDGRAEQLTLHHVDDRFFNVMSLPPLLGRSFLHDEAQHGADVAVISQATARLLWPDASPLGRTIEVLDASGEGTPHRVEVIGVVRDVVSGMLMQGVDRSAVYLPATLGQEGIAELLIRVDPARIDVTRRAIAESCLDKGTRQPCTPWTLADMTRVYRLPLAVASTLAGSLGAIALLISAAGLFGVMRFQVAARTRELGVRIALGASTTNVLWLVLRQALAHVRAGVVAGLLASLALSAVLASQIGLARAFPLTGYAGVPLLLLAVTLLASIFPALRATRIEATESLREG